MARGKAIIVGLFVVSGIAAIGAKGDKTSASNSAQREILRPRQPSARELKQAALAKITILSMDWEIGGFGTVMLADLRVKNDNEFGVKDIKVECTTAGPSGTALSSPSTVVYDSVPAGTAKLFRRVHLGSVNRQSKTAGCAIADFKQ